MHLGVTTGPDTERPFAALAGVPDGATSADGQVAGTYLHGFLGDPGQRARLLGANVATQSFADTETDRVLDILARHLEAHVAIERLLAIAGLPA